MLIFSYQTRSSSDCTATIGRTTAWITTSRSLPATSSLSLYQQPSPDMNPGPPEYEHCEVRYATVKGRLQMIPGFHVGYILKFGSEHGKHFKTPGCVIVLWQNCLLTFRTSDWLGPRDGDARSQNVCKPINTLPENGTNVQTSHFSFLRAIQEGIK